MIIKRNEATKTIRHRRENNTGNTNDNHEHQFQTPRKWSKIKKQTPIKIFLQQIVLKFCKTTSKKTIMIQSIITRTREKQGRTKTKKTKGPTAVNLGSSILNLIFNY